MTTIQLTAKFKIQNERVEEFKKLAADCLTVVNQKEKGVDALQYNWFFSPDQTECMV